MNEDLTHSEAYEANPASNTDGTELIAASEYVGPGTYVNTVITLTNFITWVKA